MVKESLLTFQSSTDTVMADGFTSKTWAILKTVYANIQPIGISETKLRDFGLSAGSFLCFIDRDEDIIEGLRAIYNGITYDVVGVSIWYNHNELFIKPLAGSV